MPHALALVAKGSNGTVEMENQITKHGTEPTIRGQSSFVWTCMLSLCLCLYIIKHCVRPQSR